MTNNHLYSGKILISGQIHGEASVSQNKSALIAGLNLVVQAMLIDLGIAAEYRLELSSEDTQSSELQIEVDDRQVRIVKQPTIIFWSADTDILMRAAESIYSHRSLLLAPEIAQALWENWAGCLEPYPEPFFTLLENLIERGIRITRLEDFPEEIKNGLISDYSFDGLFEKIVNSIKGPRFSIFVSQVHFDRLYSDDGRVRQLDGEYNNIDVFLKMVADGLFYELGILYRLENIDVDPSLQGAEIRFKQNDLHTPIIPGLDASVFLVNDTVDRLTLLNIEGRMAINPANGTEAAIVTRDGGKLELCREAGLTTWDENGSMILIASCIIRRSAGALLSTELVEYMLDKFNANFPVIVERVLELYEYPALTRILRNLLDEDISIRDLRSVLESLIGIQGSIAVDLSRYIVFPLSPGVTLFEEDALLKAGSGSLKFSESIRSELKRYISYKYTRGGNALVVYLLDPKIEARLMDHRALDDFDRQNLINAIEAEVGTSHVFAQGSVILTTFGVRARLRREIKKEYPRLAVLAYQELSPELNIQPIARIAWE